MTKQEPKHPDYYNWIPGIECIDVAENFPYNLGAALKYIWRNGRKYPKNDTTDLRKAIVYLEREIERLEEK